MISFEIFMTMKSKILVLKVGIWYWFRGIAASILNIGKFEGDRFLQNIGNCMHLQKRIVYHFKQSKFVSFGDMMKVKFESNLY
jgi:hypothetical protein